SSRPLTSILSFPPRRSSDLVSDRSRVIIPFDFAVVTGYLTPRRHSSRKFRIFPDSTSPFDLTVRPENSGRQRREFSRRSRKLLCGVTCYEYEAAARTSGSGQQAG